MALSEPITRPIGQTLLVAAALGESLGTLLGPTGAMKMVYRDAHEGQYSTTAGIREHFVSVPRLRQKYGGALICVCVSICHVWHAEGLV